jgi:hypothetical protein
LSDIRIGKRGKRQRWLLFLEGPSREYEETGRCLAYLAKESNSESSDDKGHIGEMAIAKNSGAARNLESHLNGSG